MSGLWTILGVVFVISFALQGVANLLLLLAVAGMYTWFFNESWKRIFLRWTKKPLHQLKMVKNKIGKNKKKAEIEKMFDDLKRK